MLGKPKKPVPVAAPQGDAEIGVLAQIASGKEKKKMPGALAGIIHRAKVRG